MGGGELMSTSKMYQGGNVHLPIIYIDYIPNWIYIIAVSIILTNVIYKTLLFYA